MSGAVEHSKIGAQSHRFHSVFVFNTSLCFFLEFMFTNKKFADL